MMRPHFGENFSLFWFPLVMFISVGTVKAQTWKAFDLRAEAITKHMAVLGDDSMQGRATGTRVADQAAVYLAQFLRTCGLRPAGDRGTYFQGVPMHASIPTAECKLTVHHGDSAKHLSLTDDYLLLTAGSQTVVPVPLPMVFVGYGIVAPEYDYNDYGELNVRGRVVVYFSGEPLSEDSSYFAGERPTTYSNPVMKHRLALSRGASGSVMVPLPREGAYTDWPYWQAQYAFEDVRLPFGASDNLHLLVNSERAAMFFQGSTLSMEELYELDRNGRMVSFPLATRLSFLGAFHERDVVGLNVAAALEGSDPLLRSSYVLVSAHYDHLGIGPTVKGDSVYNGVFDNASGTAAALAIAEGLAAMPEAPRRTILFLFTTGEEKGLLGSQFYCERPLVPLSSTVANVNIDGIALFDTFNDVIGVGAELSTLGQILETVAASRGLNVSAVPELFQAVDPMTSSDHLSFARAGVPSILVTEGFDYRNTPRAEGLQRLIEWGRTIYHTPFDDLHQRMNVDAALQHTHLLFSFIRELGDTFVPPQWMPGVPYVSARLRSIAEGR